ncbi:hypothetical protein HNQ91_003041 [Filimonas zeae]|uniref:Uncharacterized protein n=1 Tax=Filimonas zeae TaxID=1737353 RepID=A0A917IZK5_9BACT|nr:hypothetical protein [Filimonas zeae]MDR6339976.1 hypothetical protein [Filimonas zeae]GGH70543.1 hypothetical protein GCM10011379_28940 [Filimonas zeae]
MLRFTTLLATGIFMLASASCKKEYTAFPYVQIERFVVEDSAGNALKASIINNEIIVYWPPFQSTPDSVTPVIVVSERASITPASGTKVPFNPGTLYTVKAEDGSTQTFRLKPAINQPPLTNLRMAGSSYRINTIVGLFGEFIVPDTSVTRLYLINKDNREIPLPVSQITKINTALVYVNIPVSNTIDTGTYQLKLINNNRTGIAGPFRLLPPSLIVTDFTFPQNGSTVKKGNVFTLQVAGSSEKYYSGKFAYAIFRAANGTNISINVSTQTNNEVSFVIPADFPAGALQQVIIVSTDNSFATLKPSISITE